MKIAGFTIIRNAAKFDYPVREAIESILPICDEIFVLVGNSEDNTLELIRSIDPSKVRVFESVWDDSLKEGGRVLAEETNKAFDLIPKDFDWCFYIQADECVHEKYLPALKNAMVKYKDEKKVDGLLFKYLHFYGSYDYIGTARRWYRNEIRIIKNDKNIRSFKDAQGFRKDGEKLNVVPVEAVMFHYGWVRPPRIMKEKDINFNKMYHSDEWIKKVKKPEIEEFDYSEIDSLQAFHASHPKTMEKRIEAINWHFNFDPSKSNKSFKEKVLGYLEFMTGKRFFEYKNYRIVKP